MRKNENVPALRMQGGRTLGKTAFRDRIAHNPVLGTNALLEISARHFLF
jgi:hypothetical protein